MPEPSRISLVEKNGPEDSELPTRWRTPWKKIPDSPQPASCRPGSFDMGCLWNAAARRQNYLSFATAALHRPKGLPERERLWIEASYASLTEDYEKAVALYESLLALDPTHFWASNNLATHYLFHVRHGKDPNLVEAGVRAEQRLARLRPHDLVANGISDGDHRLDGSGLEIPFL